MAIRHCDDLAGVLEWSEASRVIAEEWMTEAGPWVIEGTAAVRAARKFLLAHPGTPPCDFLLYLTEPWTDRLPGQVTMAKGCWSIFVGIEKQLQAAGVNVAVGAAPREEG